MRPMNFATMLATATAVSVSFAPAAQAATVTIDDRIDILAGTPSTQGGDATEVDSWSFTVHSTGVVSIDVRSWLWDRDNDGTAHFIDSVIYLFADDGSLGTDDLIASNDDSPDGMADGSGSVLDSYLSLSLTAGNYILAISDFSFSASSAVSGVNTQGYMPIVFNGSTWGYNYQDCFSLDCTYGDYRLTFIGDLSVSGAPNSLFGAAAPVPLPAAGWLLVAGLGGLALSGRQKLRI